MNSKQHRPNNATPRHIVVKFLKTKEKLKIWKAGREKRRLTWREMIQTAGNLSSDATRTRCGPGVYGTVRVRAPRKLVEEHHQKTDKSCIRNAMSKTA